MSPGSAGEERRRGLWKRGEDRLERYMGGPTRGHVVFILACVLALDTSDKAALSAVAGGLERYFGVGNTEIGLLVSIVLFAGAAGTLPMGLLADRVNRTRLLAVTIALWSLTLVASGAATSYGFLLGSGVVLGLVTAAAYPTVASLIGDYFHAEERGRIYGMILAGELVGTGAGLVVSGYMGDYVSWRWAFWVLALPGAIVAWMVWWHLPEPARCCTRYLDQGDAALDGHAENGGRVGDGRRYGDGGEDSGTEATVAGSVAPAGEAAEGEAGTARRIAYERRAEPDPKLVLHEDPRDRSLWWAIKYVLRIRTNVVLIVASTLIYSYFSGLRTFAILFMDQQFGISSSFASTLVLVVGLGAIAGVYAGGQAGDSMVGKGRFNGRIVVGIAAMVGMTALFVPAYLSTMPWVGIPALTGATFFLAAADPPLDAARLDIMHPSLWGRAESVRVCLRKLGEAATPTIFGWMSESVFAGSSARGLRLTLLLMLGMVVLAALVLLLALGTYRRDVATAAASAAETMRGGEAGPRPQPA